MCAFTAFWRSVVTAHLFACLLRTVEMRRKYFFCDSFKTFGVGFVNGSDGCQALHIATISQLHASCDVLTEPFNEPHRFNWRTCLEEDYYDASAWRCKPYLTNRTALCVQLGVCEQRLRDRFANICEFFVDLGLDVRLLGTGFVVCFAAIHLLGAVHLGCMLQLGQIRLPAPQRNSTQKTKLT